jgi:putative aminopeptidase FrvX
MPSESATGTVPSADYLDRAWLRRELDSLCAIHRPSASEGEREAAEWIASRLEEFDVESEIEAENAHGTYWWPLGLSSATGALAGLAALRGRRLLGAALGTAAAAAIADDLPLGRKQLRRLLPKHRTYNVVAELGPRDAARTVVLVAHHDAAHAGLLFYPGTPAFIWRHWPWVIERQDTSPAMMWPVVGGPAAAALGALLGSRKLARLGTIVSAGAVPIFTDIGMREAVPGANDNGTAVVTLLAIARALRARPTETVRVMLVSTGSEESFSEGMQAFLERHRGSLAAEDTFFLCLDTLGSPHLTVLRGEGFLRMHEYPKPALELIDGLAEELGIWLLPNLRLRNGTDGLLSLVEGYATVTLCSVTEYKNPSNYHWPTDTPENVNIDTFADAIRLSEALIRRLDERWL